ncbi:MAG TPA: family 1 glycosylhydrolase, partial [Candidatus Bathyarchaeia archaeon]|nr:family 1 glycosylhydrolase [Candidatus Bathyarchaeia archaeon]
ANVQPAAGDGDLIFPDGFLWGISTSAHQVEGENHNNQWSAWEAAGRIKSGDRCGRACEWWINAERDFDLAREMGVNAMRISVEWSRIEPQPDVWDQQALERYREMLRGLHRRGIRPLVSLHHFTHPLWFERMQGFLAAEAPRLFERYTRRVVNSLGDLCQDWVTFNEPNVYCAMGYAVGLFPPGRRGELFTSMKVLAGVLRAHGRAYRAIHELQPGANVGWAHNYVVFQPLRAGLLFDRWITGLHHSLFNHSFVQAIAEGRLPLGFGRVTGDLSETRDTCDFFGLNVYGRLYVCFDPRKPSQLFGNILVPEDVPQGDPGAEGPLAEAYPGALRVAAGYAARLGKPVYILENGVPDAQDRIRPWLLVNALNEVHAALADGIDIRGYFHWTLTDNFEWNDGWRLRFGLVELDPATQQRTMRESGRLFATIAKQNRIPVELVNRYSGNGRG